MDVKEMDTMSEQAAAKVMEQEFSETMETSEVVRRYKDMVFSIALTHTRRRPDADDVFQEVFLVYHRKQPLFPSEERRKAWLITTTLNCSRQLTGSSWARKVIPFSEGDSEQLSSDDFHFYNEEQDAIFRAMRELPSSYRIVLHLFYFEDLSIASIADILDMQPGTVRVQLSRGRAQMKSLLKGAYFDE
ncbi:MAG: sigma-70 family RNA polymerase sigma factor [Coriobacteriales bacterium]|jgi:RNA polymerase sigma-70 factor (ECF subfamily)|nr:sigma-70 family RNA polymerase sigma factor [Coriobacteriales bacterium]